MGALAESSVDTEVGTGERLVTDTIYGIPEKSSRAAPRGFGWPRTVGKSSIISSVRISCHPAQHAANQRNVGMIQLSQNFRFALESVRDSSKTWSPAQRLPKRTHSRLSEQPARPLPAPFPMQ